MKGERERDGSTAVLNEMQWRYTLTEIEKTNEYRSLERERS